MYSVMIMACLTKGHTYTQIRWQPELLQNYIFKEFFVFNKIKLRKALTFGDYSLQADDVLVSELAHDGGLTQKVLPLLLCVAWLQGLDGHGRLLPPRHLQNTTVHLPKLPYGKTSRTDLRKEKQMCQMCLICALRFLPAGCLECTE